MTRTWLNLYSLSLSLWPVSFSPWNDFISRHGELFCLSPWTAAASATHYGQLPSLTVDGLCYSPWTASNSHPGNLALISLMDRAFVFPTMDILCHLPVTACGIHHGHPLSPWTAHICSWITIGSPCVSPWTTSCVSLCGYSCLWLTTESMCTYLTSDCLCILPWTSFLSLTMDMCLILDRLCLTIYVTLKHDQR